MFCYLLLGTIDKVMTGEIQIKELIVSKMLRQDLDKYRSLFSHVSAALHLGIPAVKSYKGMFCGNDYI
jgi:hypothetical protein